MPTGKADARKGGAAVLLPSSRLALQLGHCILAPIARGQPSILLCQMGYAPWPTPAMSPFLALHRLGCLVVIVAAYWGLAGMSVSTCLESRCLDPGRKKDADDLLHTAPTPHTCVHAVVF